MPHKRRARRHGALAAGLLLAASFVIPGPARAQGRGPVDPAGIDRLIRDSGGTARVTVHPATGAARVVRLESGRPAVRGADPRARADDFLRRYGRIFGIADPVVDLTAPQARTDRLGMTHLSYRQVYRGLPVFAGELRAHADASGRLTAVHGTFVPDIALDPVPARAATEAAATAVAFVREIMDAGPAAPLAARRTTLMIFRAGLAQGVEGPTHLAWEVEIADGAGIREFVYVDAHTGKVIDRITGIHPAIDRRIHSPFFENVVIWSEGSELPYSTGEPQDDEQVNSLIGAAKNAYDLFLNLSGGTFPSWDGADATMHSIWNIPSSPSITCPNATWDGARTNFCYGVAGDDTAAHEWTHAYTDSTHNLIYQWQSGALNEAYSDIFGETVDRLNGTGSDAPAPPRTGGQCSTFGGTPPPGLTILAPAAIAGPYVAGGAEFNPPPPRTATGTLQLVNDNSSLQSDGCEPLVGFTAGRIAVVDRGNCPFLTKVQNAQNAGAIAVVVVNNQGNGVFDMGGTGGSITIPSVLIGQGNGTLIKSHLGSGVTGTVTIDPSTDVSLRWLHSEDDSGFGGAIRDLWNPNCFAHPGRVTDTLYYACGSGDNGGVHTNSGVANHAYALIVDGGTYNGRTVAALGLTRAVHIYWRAMDVYQVSNTDFAEHADAIEMSCADLIGAPLADPVTGGPSGIVIAAPHCAAVAEAMLAVEMRTPPTFCNFQPLLNPNHPAASCGLPIYLDEFETDPAPVWTRTNSGVNPEYTPRDWAWVPARQPGGDGMALFASNDPALGNCQPGSDDQSGVMRIDSPPIVVPRDFPLLTFDHNMASEPGYDGGNLKVSVNGGAFSQVPGSAFRFNPYNMTLVTAASGNTSPLAGQPAFSGTNAGENQGSWGQSQAGLSAFAGEGDTVVLRFEFGVDGCTGVEGWYVDNVRLCSDCTGQGGSDLDGDGSRVCDGDCDPTYGATYPGAPEANDGVDNQCPGDAGAGLEDEISGVSGFFTPGDTTTFSWDMQVGAELYQVARSTAPDFSSGCASFTTADSFLVDPATPSTGQVYYYLVRPLLPFVGSWGRNGAGVERLSVCGL